MKKKSELTDVSIGARVAEQEIEGLKTYFLKTLLWEQVTSGDVDIIFGAKGSGKSAIYSYLSTLEYELMGNSTILTLAENPRGAIAFKDLSVSPPASEFEFKSIWKLYFIILIYQKLFDFNYDDQDFKTVASKLQDSDLVPRNTSFSSLVKMVRGYIKRLSPSLEPNVTLNQHSGMVENIGVKISLLEPETKDLDKGIVSVDAIFELLNKSLESEDEKVWIAIDRLDAIFQENAELEVTALRTLFQVYIDLQAFRNIRLMIFLRDDIWNRIIEKGFRETSHITKIATIKWEKESLLSLLMNRFEQNKKLLETLGVGEIENVQERRAELFKKIFPSKTAERYDFTFDWIISRIKDGNSLATPRELIQLITTAIKSEMRLFLDGEVNFESLISIKALNEGFRDASKTKLDTLVAEYPGLKHFIHRLKRAKVRMTENELKELWGTSRKEAQVIVRNLLRIGFFKNEADSEETLSLYVPMMFRPALNIQYS